jgi:hypothetical protein
VLGQGDDFLNRAIPQRHAFYPPCDTAIDLACQFFGAVSA